MLHSQGNSETVKVADPRDVAVPKLLTASQEAPYLVELESLQ